MKNDKTYIPPDKILVEYYCPVVGHAVLTTLDGITMSAYGNADCGCDNCEYSDYGVWVYVYCKACGKQHNIQDY